jgi:hypothetical protein
LKIKAFRRCHAHLGTLEASFAFCIENNISLTDDLTQRKKAEITKQKKMFLSFRLFLPKRKGTSHRINFNFFPDQLGYWKQ